MLRNESRNIKIVRLIFFFLGLLTIAVGLYATESRLVQFALHISSDKALDEKNIAFLHGLRIKIIFLGVGLVLLSMLVGFFVLLNDYILKKIESEHLIERTVSFIERLLSSVYRIGTNEKFLWCLLILILLSFSLAGIFLSSAGGFHVEGINLNPAKNLVRHGIYATLTTRGFDEHTHLISAGPGIVLPNALIFKLFGINIYYGRALYVAFLIAAVIMFYYVSRSLYGKRVALLALFLFVPWMPFQAICAADAYIPALFYFLTGALFWFKSVDTKKNVYLIISGLFWGLSFQTNWLFLFAIFAVIITCIILRLSNNGLGTKYYFIPAFMVFLVAIIWFIFRILSVGVRQEAIHLLKFWGKHGGRAVGVDTFGGEVNSIFEIARPIASLAQIDFWRDLQPFLIVPAILYIIVLIGKSKWTDYKSLFLISFVLVWFTWWLLFNFDIAVLHIQIVLIMSQLFIAKLLYDMWEYASAYKEGFLNLIKNKETQRAASVSYLLRLVIIFIVLGKTLIPLLGQAETLYYRNLTLTRPTKEMMTYIRNNTEKNAVFSGWNWSMPWYVDLDNAGDHIMKNRATYSPEQRETVPEYFIVNPEWPLVKVADEYPDITPDKKAVEERNEIRKKFLKENATLVRTFGGDKHKWLLYRVNNDNLANSPKK